MKTLFRSTILTAFILAFAIIATAQQRANNAERPRGDRQEQMQRAQPNQGKQHLAMMKRLDLTDEQKEQVQEIHLNGQKAMLPMRNQLREEMARLRTLTTSENYDEQAVQETIQTIAGLRADMMLEQVSHHQEIRELLTDEQRIKFDSFQHNKQNSRLRQGFKK